MNTNHPNTKFTFETDHENAVSFLYVTVIRESDTLVIPEFGKNKWKILKF